jgi:predicted RNase H-related nuclease YkuK (DUF458 family)
MYIEELNKEERINIYDKYKDNEILTFVHSQIKDINKIDFNTKKFKKFGGSVIDNIFDYTREYLKNDSDIRISVGCDSRQHKKWTVYAVVIVYYSEKLRNGAHYVFIRHKVLREKTIFNRLYLEALYSLELAELLNKEIKDIYYYKHTKNVYDGSYPYKSVDIHVDFNSEYNNGKNKSNLNYHSLMGVLGGYGFKVTAKPNSYASTCAADLICQ